MAAPDTGTTPDVPAGNRRSRRGVWAAALTGGALLVLGGAYGIGYALSGETLPPNTTIEGVQVGRMTPADAEQTLAAQLAERAGQPMTLTGDPEHQLTRTPAEFGLGVDYAASVARAGAEKSFNPIDIWNSLTGGGAYDAVVTSDQTVLDGATAELAQQVNVDPVSAELVFEEGQPVVKDGSNGRVLDAAATGAALADAFLESTSVDAVITDAEPDITTEEAQNALTEFAAPAVSAPVTITAGDKTFDVTPAMIASSLSFVPTDGTLKAELNGQTLLEQARGTLAGLGLDEAKDATVELRDGHPTVVPAVNGLGVDPEALRGQVYDALTKTSERTGSVEATEVEASFSTADAEALGVKEVIGEFSTNFPATAYRVTNIGKSSSLINNTLVKPGETFSMNATLGERTLANGWAAGGAIDGGRVVERMGGGISQTTTTLFNAAFFAGMTDVYHKPHSLYFSRYPMGREATLDWNSVDMKFKNESPYGVLIQAFTNNPSVGGRGTVTVRIWSTRVYDIKASDPVQSNFRDPGATIKDNGAVCSPQSGMRGFTVNYNRLWYQGGNLVRTEPFEWTYNTLTPVVCTNPNARADRIER